jgi:hypothetical protein
MSVYVDAAAHPFGRMIMCHMFSPNIDELHAMADRIGVARRWFQDPRTMQKVSWPHYDIARTKRALAVQFGAIECDRYQMVAMATVVKNSAYGQTRDPLRYFSGYLAGERARLAEWLAAQGFPQPEEVA